MFDLKKELLETLNMTDDHFYQVFCTFRFRGSMRANEEFKNLLDNLRKL